MKKAISLLLALALVLVALAGCGTQGGTSGTATSNQSAGTSDTKADGEDITLEFWTISLQPTFTDFLNGLIDQYEADHPGVKIEWVDLPYDSIQEKLVSAVAGGNAPDVVNLNSSFALNLAGQGVLVDLNKEATAEQRSIYIEPLYNSCKLGDGVYAFPWYGSPNIMLVNKALFEQAGITELPKDYTSQETLDMARKMKNATGAYLYDPYVLLYLMQWDGFDVLNADKTAAAFNTPEFTAYVQNLQAAVDEGLIPADIWGDWDGEIRMFESGQMAVLCTSGSVLNQIKDEAPDIYANLEVAYPMTGSLGIPSNPLMDLVIPEASKHHKEAIEFANYITNDASQLAFCKEASIFPSTVEACKDPFFTSDETTLEGQARALCAQVSLTCSDWSLGVAQGDEIEKIFRDLEDAVFSNGDDVATAISNAEAKVNKALSEG